MIVNEINIKIAVFGLGGVGKTSLVNKFLDQQISKKYFPTIGSNISKIDYRLSKNIIRLNIWDIGGQRSFNPLNPVYFNNNDAAFLVFDLSNLDESIKEIKELYLPNLLQKSEECITFVIGNKLDLIHNDDELKEITKKIPIRNLPLIYISALENKNLTEAFQLIAYNVLKDIETRYSSKKLAGISEEFINHIAKSEVDLERIIVNQIEAESLSLENLMAPEIETTVRKVEDFELTHVPYPEVFMEDLRDLEALKGGLNDYSIKLLNELKYNLLQLKKTPIERLELEIDRTSQLIDSYKTDMEQEINRLLKSKGKEELNEND